MSRPAKQARPARMRVEDPNDSALDEERTEQRPASDEEDGSDMPSADGGESDGPGSSDDSRSDSDMFDVDPADQIKTVSFGTLAKAQDALARKRKRGSDSTPLQEDKLAALRERLAQLQRAKLDDAGRAGGQESKRKDESGRSGAARDGDAEEGTGSDSAASGGSDGEADDDDEPSKARSSKHAPASQSTRYQVTRRRTVVDAPQRRVRDPRFLGAAGARPAVENSKAYAFIHAYEDAEMGELRAAIKGARSDDDRAVLRRKLNSMENRRKSRLGKEREQGVLREHRRTERVAVEQGKKPFYLKKSEQKKRALVDKFQGMKGKERERAMERRRKKDSQKEKKNMPLPRRIAG